MATILVRNVDEAVVEQLKAQAKQHGRSMEAEVRMLLNAAVEPANLTGEALWQFLRSGPKVEDDDWDIAVPDDYSIPPNPFEE